MSKIKLTKPARRAWRWTSDDIASSRTARLLTDLGYAFGRNGREFVVLGDVKDQVVVTRIAMQSGTINLTELLA